MNENQFDEFFRKKLLKYSSPVPKDMWQRIQQKKDKDRKGFFFKWLTAVLLVAFLTAGYFILYSNKNIVNKKAISSSDKSNIDTQNNLNKVSKRTGKNHPAKTTPDTAQIGKTNNKILSDKQFDNNKQNRYTDKHSNKKPATAPYLFAQGIFSGKYNSKQKGQSVKYTGKPGLVKGSANVHINNAPDSSINNSRADENPVKKYPDSTTHSQAVEITSLPGDSSSKKMLPPVVHTSKKETGLPPLQKKWFLDVYASPDVPFNVVTSDDAATRDFIKKSFKTYLSYTIGVGIGRLVDKHFSIKTGFQYSKINAKMVDSNGVGIANHYRSIDVPVLIGYEIKNIDFKTTINAGVVFNLYSWYKGNAIANYKNHTGISLYTGVNFTKQINNKIELFAEPYFRYRLSYMTKPQAPFNQKIHVGGVSFGLKFNF